MLDEGGKLRRVSLNARPPNQNRRPSGIPGLEASALPPPACSDGDSSDIVYEGILEPDTHCRCMKDQVTWMMCQVRVGRENIYRQCLTADCLGKLQLYGEIITCQTVNIQSRANRGETRRVFAFCLQMNKVAPISLVLLSLSQQSPSPSHRLFQSLLSCATGIALVEATN